MKRNAFIIGMLVAMGSIISSCNSDNEVECPEDFTGELTAEEEIMVGTWVLTAITADEEIDLTEDDEDNPSTDFYAQYSECQRDAVYIFSSNRTYEFEQGQNAVDCQPIDPYEGTWRLTSDNLSLVSGCTLQNTNIELSADETEFTFSNNFNVTDVGGLVKSVEITFTYSLVL